jgi:hypothetical protein
VQLGCGDLVSALDDLAAQSSQPSGADIGGVRRKRVEAGLRYMKTDRLKISARGAPGARAEIEDKLVDR